MRRDLGGHFSNRVRGGQPGDFVGPVDRQSLVAGVREGPTVVQINEDTKAHRRRFGSHGSHFFDGAVAGQLIVPVGLGDGRDEDAEADRVDVAFLEYLKTVGGLVGVPLLAVGVVELEGAAALARVHHLLQPADVGTLGNVSRPTHG